MPHVSINFNRNASIALSAADIDSIRDFERLTVSRLQRVGESRLSLDSDIPMFSKETSQAILVSLVSFASLVLVVTMHSLNWNAPQ